MKGLLYSAIIVDDEAWIREGLSEYIGWNGLDIDLLGAFADGHEALRFMEAQPVDIILSDIRMPSLSGLELITKLREQEQERRRDEHAQVIFLSGYDDFKYAQEAIRLGAFDYLLKPTEVEEIEIVLRKATLICGKQENAQDPATAVDDSMSYLIKKAIHLINEHFSEDIQLSQLAAELYVTPNYLSRLFRTETGKVFSDYLSELRMEKAFALLKEGELKIYQIGVEVGYPNPRYFSDWFHKNAGMTPGEYRKRKG